MISILEDIRKQAADITGAIQDVWKGKPLDPKRFAEKPTKWWHKKEERPVYDPPKKRKAIQNAREFWGSEMLAECLEMSEQEWRVKYGQYTSIRWNPRLKALNNQGFANRDEMIDWLESEMLADTKAQQSNMVDFSGDDGDILTPRDMGELKAYKNHRLDDYELAAKVKILKAQGLKPKGISERLKQDYQLIRHYSSALGKAEK